MKSFLATILLAAAIAAGAYFWFWRPAEGGAPTYRTANVVREDFLVSVSSTGTIEPEEVVDVGAQVAGRIIAFGKEQGADKEIDYRSEVAPGTILALIDDALYVEEVNVAKAQLAKAKAHDVQMQAQVGEAVAAQERAAADLKQMQAKLVQAQRDWDRARKLIATNVVSQAEYDAYQAAYETAAATVGVGEAAVTQARSALETRKAAVTETKADIDSAQAALNRAEKNLGYTTIRSPISGVIIERRVNIGQTVVSSLNAPSLFLIAKDLRRMEVWASVNEADIARVQTGQKVRFTVDSRPGESFAGTVAQIRLNASMTQNVVTYTVVVSFDNSTANLYPYETASLQFEVAHRPGAILVPNAALRWRPRPERIVPDMRSAMEKSAKGKNFVWVRQDDFVRPIEVKIGATNGTLTEIIGGEPAEGADVVIGELQHSESPGETVNPFTPKVFGGGAGNRPPG